ncbi:MAG: DUF4423 domain-containing protein [Bdellovibrionota bacterium]
MDIPNYRSLLLDEYLSRKKKNPSYSKRAFSRDIGLSPAFLSQLLNCKRKLSEKAAYSVCDLLDWPKSTQDLFLLIVRHELCSHESEKKKITEEIKANFSSELIFKQIALKHEKIISEWHHFAILEMTQLDKFTGDKNWLAKKLGLTLATVESSLNQLEQVGLITIEDSGAPKKNDAYITTPEVSSDALKNGHKQCIQLAMKAIDEQPIDTRDYSEVIMASSPEKLKVAKEMIADFRRKLMYFLESGEKTQLYSLNIQLFRLDRDIT